MGVCRISPRAAAARKPSRNPRARPLPAGQRMAFKMTKLAPPKGAAESAGAGWEVRIFHTQVEE